MESEAELLHKCVFLELSEAAALAVSSSTREHSALTGSRGQAQKETCVHETEMVATVFSINKILHWF